MKEETLEEVLRQHRVVERWRVRNRPGTKVYDDAMRELERLEHRIAVLEGTAARQPA